MEELADANGKLDNLEDDHDDNEDDSSGQNCSQDELRSLTGSQINSTLVLLKGHLSLESSNKL